MSAAQSLIAQLGTDADDEVLRLDVLEGETDALEFVRRLIRGALELEAMAGALRVRLADLSARRERFDARAEAARETARDMLEALGMAKLVDAEFTASVRPGRPQTVITDMALLPEEYVRVACTPLKAAIRASLDAGHDVPGAQIGNGAPPVLTVKTK